jgi:hypothetical protein
MDPCSVVKKSGKLCKSRAEHSYNGRPLCIKHWNNGRLTKTQPADEVKEARRRIDALNEISMILDYVMRAVIKNKRMSYRAMADMAIDAANSTGILNKKERRDVVKLIITSVRLRRECNASTEKKALKSIGELIQEICDTPAT